MPQSVFQNQLLENRIHNKNIHLWKSFYIEWFWEAVDKQNVAIVSE